jgi:hypothetical protein
MNIKRRTNRLGWKRLLTATCGLAACMSAMAQLVIPVVDFDADTVGSPSANPNIVHSTIPDWTVAVDTILDPAAPEQVYESNSDQTNIKVEFPSTTLAPGQTLRVKVDYRYVSPPTSPGIQQFNFLRFGAYRTFSTATFTDDKGYLADVSYWQQGAGSKSGDFSIRREDNVWDDFDLGPLLDNQISPVNFTPPAIPETGDIRTMSQPDGFNANWPKPSDDGTANDHAAVICVSNTGTTTEVCLYHGFPPVLIGKAVDTTGSPIITFDTVYLESPSDNNGFHIDNIGVQLLGPELACCSGCVEVQDLILGDTYLVGDTFTVNNVSSTFGFDVLASDYIFTSGTAFGGGFAEVENTGLAGYFGNELKVNNINLQFTPTAVPPMGVSVLFGEYGGNINLSVNGVFANVSNFIDLDGASLGGAMISVPTGGFGNDTGELLIYGTAITQFTIGGQELWIDHICDYENQIPPSDCPLTFYDDRDNGPVGGGEPNPLATGWTYPNSQAEQTQFLADLATFGLTHELITFEQVNGWSPVNGTGDMFAGSGAPYAGGPYTTPAFGGSGTMAAGDASGSVAYLGADNTVTFTLYSNGHSAGIDEPGMGDMDSDNDTDRGINTSPSGFHFIEALPSENLTGGLTIEFQNPVPAAGMYVMGVEENKREIEVAILHADGSLQVRTTDITAGPHNEGGIQFVGYLAPDLQSNACWIKSITFNEPFDGEPAGDRDIFSVDDVIYVASEINPPLDPQDPGDPNDPQNPGLPNVTLGDPIPGLINQGVVAFPLTYENVTNVTLTPQDVQVLPSGTVTFDPNIVLNQNGNVPAIEVTITGGDGTLAIQLAPGTGINDLGQSDAGATSPIVAVDNTPPTLSVGIPFFDGASRNIVWPLSYDGAIDIQLLPELITAELLNSDVALGPLSVLFGDTVDPIITLESFPAGVTGDLVLTVAQGASMDGAGNLDAGANQTLIIKDQTFAATENPNDPDGLLIGGVPYAFTMKLIDGYIAGALVFFDENRNNQHEGGEPFTFTNNQGAFQLVVDLGPYDDNGDGILNPSEGVLVMQEGVDLSTGLPFEGQFLAPAGAGLASPLSSLIVAIVDLNPTFTFAQAQASIKQGLNLSAGINLNDYDPLQSAEQGDVASGSVMAAGAMVQDTVFTMTLILNTAAGGNIWGTIQAESYRYIADLLMRHQPVDFSDATFLKQMMDAVALNLAIALPGDIRDTWASMLATSNQLKQSAGDSNAPADAVTLIAKAQLVTQSQLSGDLAKLQDGQVNADAVEAAYGNGGLLQIVNQAPVGDVFANENRVGTFSFTRANFDHYEGPVLNGGAQMIGLDEISIKRENGNQQTVTLLITPTDGTATNAGGDYVGNTIEVTFGDTEIFKTISLENTILEDAFVEGDETLNLQLSLKPGAPANAQLGAQIAATVNVLDNDAAGTFAFATAQVNVIEGDSASQRVVIERTQGLSGQVQLDVTMAPLQGAVAGSDFNAAQLLVTFDPGVSRRVINIPVIDDLVQAEANETFQMTLAIAAGSAPGAVFGAQSQLTATIVDNDVAAQAGVTSAAPSVDRTLAGPVVFDLKYVGAVSVDVRLVDLSLVKTGTANGTISLTGGTSGTPQVTISGISGDGALALQVAPGRGLDGLGNGDAGLISSAVIVDNSGPIITVGNPSATLTQSGPIVYEITYETDAFAVNLTEGHIQIEGGLNVQADVQVLNGQTRTPSVVLTNITGQWSPNIRIAQGSSQDILGNADLGAVSASFEILGQLPQLNMGVPSVASTQHGPVSIPLFYIGVNQVSVGVEDLELIQTGTAVGQLAVEAGDTMNPRVVISGIGGTGTLAIRVKSGRGQNSLGIFDNGGLSPSFVVDNSAPVLSINTPITLTKGNEVFVHLRYEGAHLIVLREEFVSLQYDGSVTAQFELQEIDSITRYVRIFDIQGEGAIRANVAPGKAMGVTGIHENQGGSSQWIHIDRSAPIVSWLPNEASIVNAGPVMFGLQFEGADLINLTSNHLRLIQTGDAQASLVIMGTPENPNQRLVVLNDVQGNGTLQLEISTGSASDHAGNVDEHLLLSPVLTVDQLAPQVSFGDPSSLKTQGETITVSFTVQEGILEDLSADDFQIVGVGEGLNLGVSVEMFSVTEAVVSLSGFDGEGSLRLSVGNGAAKDEAGNLSDSVTSTWSIEVTKPEKPAAQGKLAIQGSILSLYGTLGEIYVLEHSVNFQGWEPVAELEAAGMDTALNVDVDISSGNRFYRIRLLN